jgi:hypothetical protein
MTETKTKFELKRELPDGDLLALAERLVGFRRRFERIGQQMRLLTDLDGVRKWAESHHGTDQALTAALGDRYPLVIFHGDVGTGKTATAEAAAAVLCQEIDTDGFLLKLSTRVRGIGHVGEMSDLIGDAFAEATTLAGKKRFVAMIIDEGVSSSSWPLTASAPSTLRSCAARAYSSISSALTSMSVANCSPPTSVAWRSTIRS